jgi:riboflavin synthase
VDVTIGQVEVNIVHHQPLDMFTGLIEHVGTVSSIITDSGGCTLTISKAAQILGDCHIGDSIAVNGACLTVVEFSKHEDGGWFKVWLANETLDRTDLGTYNLLVS